MYHNLFSLSLSAAAVSFALVASPSTAQQTDTDESVERIIVTSDFRQRNLDQLSASATIIGADRLASRQATHLDSVLAAAPNVNFASGASRGRFVQIRGIGERSQFAEPINPSVSFLVDDFDFSGLAAAGLLFDTRQLEVFRGPQATLFGTGALAGAIKLSSYAPGEDAPDYVEGRLATQDSYRFEAATGGALNQNWNYRVAGMHNRSDGFVTNTYLNREDTDNIDESAVKVAVSGQLDERTTLAVNYRFYDIDNGYDAFSLENTRNTRSDEPGFDRHQTHAISVKSLTQTEGGDLTVIATHASHNIGYGYDEDWTYTGFHPDGYSSFDAYFREVDTQTAEIRFSSIDSSALFDGRTQWLLGALYKTSEESLLRQYTYSPEDFASEFEPDTSAAYVQTDTALTDALSLVVGLRAENYDFDYMDNAGLRRQRDTDMVGGKAALQYQAGRHFWYASVSRGYKGAGFNPDERVNEQSRFFDEEYNWNYEVGVKGPLLTPDLTVRTALFFMDRTDTQVSDFDVLSRDNGSAEFIDIIDNADRGTNQGVEIEFSWQLTDRWLLKGSAGYLDATFEGYVAADGSVVDEQRQAQAPEYTANLFSEVMLHQNWLWRVTIDFKDEYRFSDGHDETAPATTLMNTEVVWANRHWEAAFWVQNLLDEEYYVRGFGGFNNDPRDGYFPAEPYYQLGDGRQTGITVRYYF